MEKEKQIMQKLIDNGYQAYVTGGAVRDIVMNKTPSDYDLVTNARPNQIIELFQSHKCDLVGQSFGVVIVDNIEVATFRKDKYNGLSDKDVVITYSDTLEEDSERRDFSFNSLYMDINGNIIDPQNGLSDINNKIVRFIGNPDDRIYEDPNRILRAIRFKNQFNFTYDFLTENSIIYNRNLVSNIARERIRVELLKLLKNRKSSGFFADLRRFDILKYIFPSLNNCYNIKHDNKYHREDIFTHCLNVGDRISCRYPLLKLVGYLHDVGKADAKKWNLDRNEFAFIEHELLALPLLDKELESLKFSTDEKKYILKMTEYHMSSVFDSKKEGKKRIIKRLGENDIDYKDLIRFKIADRHGAENNRKRNTISEIKELLKQFKVIIDFKEPCFKRDLAINGFDVMNILDIKPGKDIGRILNECMELVLLHPEHNNYVDLSYYIKMKGQRL
jgi:tRNA nucleotidyltransferase/poly(A) polymerase